MACLIGCLHFNVVANLYHSSPLFLLLWGYHCLTTYLCHPFPRCFGYVLLRGHSREVYSSPQICCSQAALFHLGVLALDSSSKNDLSELRLKQGGRGSFANHPELLLFCPPSTHIGNLTVGFFSKSARVCLSYDFLCSQGIHLFC